MIYLDNAATTGHKPQNVIAAVDKALKFYSANPGRSGHTPSERTAEAVYEARKKVCDFFGASGPERVVFTSGCTQSINCVIKGVAEKADHVIVSGLEHNSVIRPLEKAGIDYSTAEVSLTDDNLTVENFRRLIRHNTVMIFTTAASNVLGKRLPLREIGALCRERNILFGVDAAQTAGIYPIDMKKDNIDFLCAAPHKGLYAPMGVGILIAEKRIRNTITEGGTGVESISRQQPESMPERMESGTLNVPGIFGVSAGIDFINRLGTDKISDYENRLVRIIYNSFSKNGRIRLYAPEPLPGLYAPVISFNIEGKTSSEAAGILNENGVAVRAGLHCAPSAHKIMGTLENGAVRVCPSVFNSEQEIYNFINIVNNV